MNPKLDCRVYSMAALSVLNADLKMLLKNKKAQSETKSKVNQSRLRNYKKKGNFVSSWEN